MTLGRLGAAVVAAALAGAAVAAAPPKPETKPDARADAPPANLMSGEPAHGAALDPVFAHFKLDRLACTFQEDKHIALLARPLHTTGAIYYARDRGVSRETRTPRPERVVVTRTALRIRKGDHVEDIPLDKSKDLKAFALIFPTILRGDRGELERSFDLGLYGSDAAWWALAFTPRAESMRALLRRVVVFGKKDQLVALQIVEASGDTTDTRLADVRRNGEVPDAEIAAAFGAP
jgi:outer membrane lipoprotein carrier protein LolA